MVVVRGRSGTGITEGPTLHWDSKADEGDPEVAAALEKATLGGLIASIERECFAITVSAGLPGYHGSFSYREDSGEWHDVSPDLIFDGWSIANDIWTIARARGYELDEAVGYASRMLADIIYMRRAQEKNDYEWSALRMFHLGVKWGQRRLKEDWEKLALAGAAASDGSREGAEKRAAAYAQRHEAIRANFAERLARLNDEQRAKAATAKDFQISRRQLNRILAK